MASLLGAFSTRSTYVGGSFQASSFQETSSGSTDFGSLNTLITTLIDNKVPGPQLFRLDREFKRLEVGGQSDIMGIDPEIGGKIRKARKKDTQLKWPVDKIVIKRHTPRGPAPATDLGAQFMAARREVLALAPSRFRGHPNIVQLLGWGLCLDTIEDADIGALQMPLLVLERADMDMEALLREKPAKSPQLILQLCSDIGNGIEALHHNGFTHGDLKPKNVLVFRTITRWVAKLCDFGCARAQVERSHPGSQISAPSSRVTKYYGTDGWRPPEVASGQVKNLTHEDLQLCDIYVYGLLVWSALCNSGRSCVSHDRARPETSLRHAKEDVQNTVKGFRRLLAHRIIAVLEASLRVPQERSLTPWRHLHAQIRFWSADSEGSPASKPAEEPQITTLTQADRNMAGTLYSRLRDSLATSSSQVFAPLNSDQKRQYETMPWWVRDSTTDEPGLVSSGPGNDDYYFHSIAPFSQDRRSGEIQFVQSTILTSLRSSEEPAHLYYCARFRSRMSIRSWQAHTPASNLVEFALRARPTPDICTMAWLCRGEIGIWETQNLGLNFDTWKLILEQSLLNESERLERFLLLLQFGARIEKKMPPSKVWLDKPRSVLFEYIRSCRRSTVGMVMKEICNAFQQVKDQPHISKETRDYMTGSTSAEGSSRISSAWRDFIEAVDYDAVFQLQQLQENKLLATSGFELSNPLRVAQSQGVYRREYRLDAQRIVDLIQQQPMETGTGGSSRQGANLEMSQTSQTRIQNKSAAGLSGWDRVEVSAQGEALVFYRDLLTQSITTMEPRAGFFAGSHVRIGYQDVKLDGMYLDLSVFFRREMTPQVTAAFAERFPVFNDAWFVKEQYLTARADDVLRLLVQRWDLTSFAERVDVSWVPYFLAMWAMAFQTSWSSLVVYGLRFAPLLLLLTGKLR